MTKQVRSVHSTTGLESEGRWLGAAPVAAVDAVVVTATHLRDQASGAGLKKV